ncbi:MAG TPA: extracellular solute-binding protein [Phycisphaerae bacterium]
MAASRNGLTPTGPAGPLENLPMIELRGITSDHPRGLAPLLASVEPYAAQRDVRVTWDRRSLKDFGDAPLEPLAAKYDLLMVDHPQIGRAAQSGCLLPLDEVIEAESLVTLALQSAGPSHASYEYAGHQWALAVDAGMQSSAYRPDLLQLPLPESWADVIVQGERLLARGLWAAIPLSPRDAVCSFLTLCASLGDPPGQADRLVDPDIGRRALEWLRQMRRVSHPACTDWDPVHALVHMSNFDDLAYIPLTFCYTNYSRPRFAPKRVRFASIPGVRGATLGGTGLAVSAECRHAEQACDYALWLCSAAVQRTLYVEHGGQPGNGEAWTDDQANELTGGFFHDTLESLRQAYVRPRYPGWPQFQRQAGELIHAMLVESGDAEACLARLSELYVTS